MNEKVIQVIKGYRHKNYERTVQIADFAKKIVTGVGYGELVIGYKLRETGEMIKQRIHITQNRTTAIEEKTAGFLRQAFRKDKLKFKTNHKDGGTLERVGQHTRRFGKDGQTAIEYCEQSALFYARVDPNVFYWVRHVKNSKDEYFEPIIFESAQIYDFKIKKGDINFAVTGDHETVTYQKGQANKKKQESKNLKIYYYFGEGTIETSIEWNKDIATGSSYYEQFSDEVMQNKTDVDNVSYITITEPYDSKVMPISRIGYKYDLQTNREVYVTYFDGAVPQFKQLVKIGSEYDLSLTLHAFLQKVGYYVPCDHAVGASRCVNGTMQPEESTCQMCHGTGQKVATTSQESIMIKFPDVNDTVSISPKDLVWYIQLPIDIVRLQKEIVDEYEPEITKTIYGVDMGKDLSSNGARTAEEVRGFNDKAQDAIYDFTKSPKRMFLHTMEVITSTLGVQDFTTELEYSPEYDLQSEASLLADLKRANEASASSEIINNIKDRIVNKQNRADTTLMRIYKAMRQFEPFAGVPQATKDQLLLSLPSSDLQKATYFNFSQITERIMENAATFLEKDRKGQQAEIDKLAKEFSDMMVKSESVLAMRDQIIDDEIIEE